MLNHPTLDKLLALRLTGMAKALSEQMDLPESQALSFEERLGLLVDREMTVRSDRRLTTRLRQAKLRLSASMEDLDYRHPRGLDKALMLRLASCQWVHERHNVLITGPRQCTRELWSYHLGTRHISNSSSVRQRSVNPSSIAGEYFLYLTSKRLACGLIHCRNAWFASTKL